MSNTSSSAFRSELVAKPSLSDFARSNQPSRQARSVRYNGYLVINGSATLTPSRYFIPGVGWAKAVRHSLFLMIIVVSMLITCRLQAAEEVDFQETILPLLTDRCLRCHGPDEETLEAGLRLDNKESATAELDSGSRAIVPFSPAESELLRRVATADEGDRMPPADAGERLTASEISALRAWIEEGAEYKQHWSFEAPKRPDIPHVVSDPKWPVNAIDRFVMRKLDRNHIRPQAPADRYTLLRRVALDLTGIPPTIEQVDRFAADKGPGAYERAVDRLLSSPAYGERWARNWLDLARYADSAGYAQDPLRTIWRYRDWVIDSMNSNKPFDQFTVEQIAGDLLPEATDDQILATAFHRNTMTNSEGGTDDEEFRNAAVVDRVNTTMQVWMGITMGCAQCHSHKYDPITQEEYFQFFAVFNNTADADRGDESPLLTEYSRESMLQRDRLLQKIAELESDTSVATSGQDKKRLVDLRDQLAKVPAITTPIMRELPADSQRATHIQIRGNFRQKGDPVEPGVPSAFHDLESSANRLHVAQWLVSERNPLTARVVVNRYWESLFGVGIVETSEDFGLQGERPSHPDLLDYLATELMRKGWDIKWLLRTIVTSATYRQASTASAELATKDPHNRLLGRGPRFRMSAEMIRDQALAVSELLSKKMRGPSVRPPRPNLELRSAFGGSTDWQPSEGEDRYRRGIYTRWRRTTPYPSLATFDAPSREVCTIRRIRTNTPLQALVTLNDPAYVEAAQALARRTVKETSQLKQRIRFIFRQVVLRPPTADEVQRLEQLYHEVIADYQNDPEAAKLIATDPIGPFDTTFKIDMTELAAWTVVANVMLNLDETIARP